MDRVYRDQILEVEPTGIERVTALQRHGSPRALFGVWFSANAEIATWMVGVSAAALYGTSLRGGVRPDSRQHPGLCIARNSGDVRAGVRRSTNGRIASGIRTLRKCRPGSVELSCRRRLVCDQHGIRIVRAPDAGARAVRSSARNHARRADLLAVYGYNLIHRFEAVCAVLLAVGFAVLGAFTFARADWNAPFNPHAPLAAGGEIGGIVLASALAFSYATGWLPCASDYSRYLPKNSDPRSIIKYAFVGAVLPCIVLEIMGTATVNVVRGIALGDAIPTQAIASLLGSAAIATPVLFTVALGTLAANCMNLYSGAMAALVVKFPGRDLRAAALLGAGFGVLAALLMLAARVSPLVSVSSGGAIFLIVAFAGAVRMRRWIAAIFVGAIGALLAAGGGQPAETAKIYTNFLLLLSYWASPWAAVVLVAHLQSLGDNAAGADDDFERIERVRWGAVAWLAGLLLSIPFWNQAWYTGAFAGRFPQFGDLSYYAGFIVAAVVMALRPHARRLARS